MLLIVGMALGALAFVWLNARKRIEALETRIAALNAKEQDEAGALGGTLLDMIAQNLVLKGLLKHNSTAASELRDFAENYPIKNSSDEHVMTVVISLVDVSQ